MRRKNPETETAARVIFCFVNFLGRETIRGKEGSGKKSAFENKI